MTLEINTKHINNNQKQYILYNLNSHSLKLLLTTKRFR